MGGPIVRTGTTPAFWQNWDKVFGKPAKGKASQSETAAKATAQTKKKTAAKAQAQPAAKKVVSKGKSAAAGKGGKKR